MEDGFTDDVDNAGSEDDELQMDTEQDNAEEVTEIEEQSGSSDEADTLDLDAGDAAVAGEKGTTSEFEYWYNGKEASIAKYIGSSKLVSVPSSIGGYTVTSIGGSAFKDTGITYVSIPNTVKAIESQAFAGCSGLYSLTIPNSVTRLGVEVIRGTSVSRVLQCRKV